MHTHTHTPPKQRDSKSRLIFQIVKGPIQILTNPQIFGANFHIWLWKLQDGWEGFSPLEEHISPRGSAVYHMNSKNAMGVAMCGAMGDTGQRYKLSVTR